MASDWIETTLSKVILTNHQSYSKNDNWSFINYLDTGNITENNISDVQYLKVGIDKIPSRAKRKVDSGDIIYSTVRPNQKHFGILRNPLDNMLVSTGFTTIRCKSAEADTNFIYWFLVQPQIIEHLQSIGEQSASAYPSIKPSDIESLDIRLPPIEEQKVIAHILGSLDDKIELNRQMNETLEAMAQALFKSWFVDFDPVIDNALAAGNAIPDELFERAELRKGIEKKENSDIQSLFPDEFEFTEEMGWIPKGWENGTLGDFAILGNGKTSPDRTVGEIPVFGSNGKIGDCDESNRDNTIIIGRVGSYCGSLQYYPSRCWITDNAMSAEMENKVHNIYLFQLLLRDNLNDRRTGSGQPLLNQSVLRSIKTILPSVIVIDEYSRIANSLYEKIDKANGNNETLAKLRDTLLPKLMSGELRISDTL